MKPGLVGLVEIGIVTQLSPRLRRGWRRAATAWRPTLSWRTVHMKDLTRFLWLALGLILGGLGSILFFASSRPAEAANDRYEDFILCTGPVAIQANSRTDGVWLLDYRSGKL